jgi:hypothetical protein
MSRVIFVNRFYWPEEPATAQLLADLAPTLVEAGRQVAVIASHPGRIDRAVAENHRSVSIVRVRGSRPGKNHLPHRALDFVTFMLGARQAVAALAQPGDLLVAMTDPPLLDVALAGFARRKNLRLIHWIQDVFPEIAEVIGHPFVGVFRGARDRAWRAADACVVLGEDMAAHVRRSGVPSEKIRIIPNWAPLGLAPTPPDAPEVAALRRAWGLEGKFIVTYSGNLGRVHDFSAITPLAEALRDEPQIAIVFIGDGAQRAALESDVRARGLRNVRFFPAQPRAQLATTLALGDAHLVTLRADCASLVFPSKLYGIAAVGRPVLFLGAPDCEVARLVTRNGFGRAFAPCDVSAQAATIRMWRDDPARCVALDAAAVRFSDRAGGLHHAGTQWRALIEGKPLAAHPSAASIYAPPP